MLDLLNQGDQYKYKKCVNCIRKMAAASNHHLENEEEGLKEGSILTEFSELQEVLELIENIPACIGDLVCKERCDEVFTRIVDEYLEQPHLLDPHLDMLLQKLLVFITKVDGCNEETDIAFRYLYLLCKVRGYKNMTKKFPHEVKDIEPILDLLSKQQPNDPWETRYMLLLWLSMICLIPFDMSLFDDPKKIAEEGVKPMSLRIMDFGKHYLLTSSDNSQEAAAVMLAKFLIRPDTTSNHLDSFVRWCIDKMSQSDCTTMKGITKIKGCLRCLALVFKFGKRDELHPLCEPVLKSLTDFQFLQAETVLRKLSVKVTQRVGMTLLKPRIASWRYQRGNRHLDSSLTGFKATVNINESDNKEDDDDFEVPEDIETVLDVLLTGLKDKDTIVRWSSAKGVGRITGRLPKDFADQVLESLLDSYTFAEAEGAWHGGCLALAELGRRGLLLPERLHMVVPVLVKSLNYDERRGASSVGSNVRDAACYLAWAFARAYEPVTLERHINKIARALLITAVFDREVNCRRAASAAFQENVGRQGSFPHGIDIVTMVDYFTVSNRSNSYLKIAPKLAAFGDYTNAFIDHLVESRMNHWDEEIRWLAAEAMNKLTKFRPEYVAEQVLEKLVPLCTGIDVVKRHGSIIMVAEIVAALSEIESSTGNISLLTRNARLREIYRIVKILKDACMFRGLSGEQMRAACSHLITRLSQCTDTITVPRPTNESWAELLHDTLSHLHLFTHSESICRLAISALSAMNQISLTAAPFASLTGASSPQEEGDSSIEASVDQYLSCLMSDTESKRRGYAQAIGSLPKPVLDGRLMKVLRGLFRASQVTDKEDVSFAEARRDAINGITRACQTLGMSEDNNPDKGVCQANITDIYDAVFRAIEDYTRDSRGDVGSYVRGSAICALYDITSMTAKKKPELLTAPLVEMIMKKLLRQACEKLHKIRQLAVDKFVMLLHKESIRAFIPHYEELVKIFPAKSKNFNITELFKRLSRTLDLEKYAYEAIYGLVVSVGDLTQSLAEASGSALLAYMNTNKTDVVKVKNVLTNLITVLKSHSKNQRVSIPFLKTLNQLLVSNCFDALNSDEYVDLQLDLVSQIKVEILRTKDAQKVLLSVPVFCNLLFFVNPEVRRKVLFQLMVFLCHRFPIVRKATATQLYEQLNIYIDLIADEEQLETTFCYLLEVEWDQEEVSELKPKRNEMCGFFDVAVPQVKGKKTAT